MAAPARSTARTRSYDRSRVLKKAATARSKRKHKKAIALYRKVLADEPGNADLHKKLAPLLATTGQRGDALRSYRIAAEGLVQQGFDQQAIGLLRAAAAQLPREAEIWRSVAELEVSRGRVPDAVGALAEGRRHFRSRRLRAEAIQLLLVAQRLDPNNFPIAFDLACLLGKTGRRRQAIRLLDGLATRVTGRNLRRVRRRLFRLSPSPSRTWQAIRVHAVGR